MMQEERNKKRNDIYNLLLLRLQLMGVCNSYGSFINEFEFRMKKELGEYTEIDEQWVVENLDRFVAHQKNTEEQCDGNQ